MAVPKLFVAGHCTASTAKLLAIFDPPLSEGTFAHLSYETHGQKGVQSSPSVAAFPYSQVLFELEGLPASKEGSMLLYSVDSELGTEPREFGHPLKLLPSGRPLRIALVSCNGVYRVTNETRRFVLWRALKEQIAKGNVDAVIHAGDQIYADAIPMQQIVDSGSTSIGKSQRLVEQYRQTYVETWSAPDIASVLASSPSWMMWDDHDIFDGYGSHRDDSSILAQTIFSAAKIAFQEFQAQKNPSPLGKNSFAYAFLIDRTAILVLDGRSNRMWTKGQILGEQQLQDVEKWIDFLAGQKPEFFLVVTAVPFLHVPVMSYLKLLEVTGSPGGLVEDLRDSWTAANNVLECRRMLSAVFDFARKSPESKIFLLSGDVHVATAGTIRREDQTIRQIVSSGIGSPPPYGIVRMILRWAASEQVSLMDDTFRGRLERMADPVNDFLLFNRNFAILDLAKPNSVEFFADFDGKVSHFPVSW